MGGVDDALKWVALVIWDKLSGWCVRQCRRWCIISQTLPETRLKWKLFKTGKRIQVSGHIHCRHTLLFRVSLGYFFSNFKVVSRIESKLRHNQNPRYIKNDFNIPCESLAYWDFWYTQNLGILRTWDIFKILWIYRIQFT